MKMTLRQVRKLLCMTQRDIADSIGITVNRYATLERGESPVLLRISMAIECLLWRRGVMKNGDCLNIVVLNDELKK